MTLNAQRSTVVALFFSCYSFAAPTPDTKCTPDGSSSIAPQAESLKSDAEAITGGEYNSRSTGLRRTLGMEWEVSPVDELISGKPERPWDEMARKHELGFNKDEAAYASPKVRELFGFYGLDQHGVWVEGLIPDDIVKQPEFQEIKQIPGVQFKEEGGHTFLMNYKELGIKESVQLTKGLMHARGQHREDFKLRKIPGAWLDKQNKYDQLIPDEVAEEWRGEGINEGGKGVLVNLEFPMQGFVHRGSDLREYVKNLWIRLGFIRASEPKLDEALDKVIGHVHWVPDVQGIPRELRQRIYESMIGYWGDLNDWMLLDPDAVAQKNPKPKITWDNEDAISWYSLTISNFRGYSITPLTQDLFLRLSATPDGILVKDRAKDLNPSVDTNIPPAFKRLHVGFRGKYGQSSLPDGAPIPIVGIEARNFTTMKNGLSALPMKKKGKSEVDVAALLEHSSRDARGINGSLEFLDQRASQLKLDPFIITEARKRLEKHTVYWPSDKAMGKIFLPLNDWLNHPSVKRNLLKKSSDERSQAIERYKQALDRYIHRINDLAKARQNPKYTYYPDWNEKIPQFSDGINRVYPREKYPEMGRIGELRSDPNLWFDMVLFSESTRFTLEANLSELLKPN